VALVVVVVLTTRLAWMSTVPHLAGLLDPGTRRFEALAGPRKRLILGFAGLRGAVSVAAVGRR
jgi:NhaP-type Na+/H+ or K+/H+ antiporter